MQIVEVADSVITARHRMSALVGIGALRRFRPYREVGSAPWHYLLGPIGAALLGAEDRDEANWFFAALAAHARAADGETGLREWLNGPGPRSGCTSGRCSAPPGGSFPILTA
jgi:hypothetical protein